MNHFDDEYVVSYNIYEHLRTIMVRFPSLLFPRSYALVSEHAIFHANFRKMRFQHAYQPSDEIIRRHDHVCFYVDYVRVRRTIRRSKVANELFLPDRHV